MVLWHVDVMWALVLFGLTLFTIAFVVVNRALRAMRPVGLGLTYATGAWMFFALPWLDAAVTWCAFALAGGALVFLYELWARRHYGAEGRRARPLVLLEGFVLWPMLLPDAVEGMVVDLGILPPSAP